MTISDLYRHEEFDLTRYIESDSDYDMVMLWKVIFGHPALLDKQMEPIYILAITASHAVALAEQWQFDSMGSELDLEPVFAVECIASFVVTDKRFVCSSGNVKCPDHD